VPGPGEGRGGGVSADGKTFADERIIRNRGHKLSKKPIPTHPRRPYRPVRVLILQGLVNGYGNQPDLWDVLGWASGAMMQLKNPILRMYTYPLCVLICIPHALTSMFECTINLFKELQLHACMSLSNIPKNTPIPRG